MTRTTESSTARGTPPLVWIALVVTLGMSWQPAALLAAWVNPTHMLVLGTNVMAVHAFNANLTSSDLVIDLSLATIAPDLIPPVIAVSSTLPACKKCSTGC